MFRNEHILIDTLTLDTVKERFQFLADAKILSYDKQTMVIQVPEKPSFLLQLFAQMAQAFVDTYLVVLLTFE